MVVSLKALSTTVLNFSLDKDFSAVHAAILISIMSTCPKRAV